MAFTTPATAVSGAILTAAWLNTYVRDNIAWMATDSPACRANRTTAFAHNSSGNWLSVPMDAERFDNAAMHSTVSATDRITVPTGGGGKYMFGGAVEWQNSSAGWRYLAVTLNGITTYLAQTSATNDATLFITQSLMTMWHCAAGDYALLAGWQNSAGTLNIQVKASYSPEFYAFWFRT